MQRDGSGAAKRKKKIASIKTLYLCGFCVIKIENFRTYNKHFRNINSVAHI